MRIWDERSAPSGVARCSRVDARLHADKRAVCHHHEVTAAVSALFTKPPYLRRLPKSRLRQHHKTGRPDQRCREAGKADTA